MKGGFIWETGNTNPYYCFFQYLDWFLPKCVLILAYWALPTYIVITTKLDSQLGKGQRKRKGSIWVSLDPITISFLEWHWINQLWGRTILLFYRQCFSKLAILHSISCLLANFVPSHIHTYIKPIWQMGTLEFNLPILWKKLGVDQNIHTRHSLLRKM